MSTENQKEKDDLKSFISVKNGPLCNNMYLGYIQVVHNSHPTRSIWVNFEVTSDPPLNDVTGEVIRYNENCTVGPKSSTNLHCDVPGPTRQRFFWTPIEARWA